MRAWWCSTRVDAAERGADIRTRTRCVAAERDDGALAPHAARCRHRASSARSRRGRWSMPPGPGCATSWPGGRASERAGAHPAGQGQPHRRRRLFDHDRAYIFQNADGRIIFAIPYEHDFTLIGTTDQDYHGDPGRCRHQRERDRLSARAAVERLFRASRSTRDRIRWTYSGVRPLYDDGASKAAGGDARLRAEARCRAWRGAAAVGLRRQDHHLPPARRSSAGAASALLPGDGAAPGRRGGAAGRRLSATTRSRRG